MGLTPLKDRFDAMVERSGVGHPALQKIMLEAFMAGAAAHDNVIREATENGADAQTLARICDDMVAEMERRHG